MTIFNYIILTLIFCITPAGVVWLCRRVPLLGKIGPIMVLYAVGMILGNLPFIPSEITTLQELLPNVMVPLAIPMMLFGCVFTRKEARLQIKIVASGFISVCIAVAAGYLLCGQHLAEGDKVGGIITGMYTGGTLNAAALQAIFRINSETYILINTGDVDGTVGQWPYIYADALTATGTENTFYVTAGGHDFTVWKHGLYNFALRIFD